MAENKAVVVLAPGKVGIVDAPYPTLPGDNWLIVRTTAVAINPTDISHIAGEGVWDATGCRVGFDYAGIVEEVGSAVTKPFKKGDRISGCAHGTNYLRESDGAFAKYITVHAEISMHTPDNLTDEEAASLGVSIFTTGFSMYLSMGLPLPTEPAEEPFDIFVYGGSTAMGISAIQFAKLSGATVITTSSPANADYVQSLGADHVLDYTSPTLQDEVLALARGGKLKYAYDCHSSNESAALCARLLNDEDAFFICLRAAPVEVILDINPGLQFDIPLGYLGFGEPIKYPEVIPASPKHHEHAQKFVELSRSLFAQGKVKPPRVFVNRGGSGLEGVLVGLEELKNKKVSGGKLVYTM